MDDQIENLRLHSNGNLLAAQLAQVGVEKVILEQKLQGEKLRSHGNIKATMKSNWISAEVCGCAEAAARFSTIA